MTAFNQQPEVCNVLGDSITLRLTSEQTNGNYSVAEFATPRPGMRPTWCWKAS